MQATIDKIIALSNEKAALNENIARLKELNAFDQEAPTINPANDFKVSFSGGSAGTSYTIKTNAQGDSITAYFVGIWQTRVDAINLELDTLVNQPVATA